MGESTLKGTFKMKSTVKLSFFLKFFCCLPWIFTNAFATEATLLIGPHKITAEVADTDHLRQQGLMNRPQLKPNHGMIFVFPELNTHCMWMKNTPLNLSVAFVEENGHIINIEKMQAHTLTPHCAKLPARYALEMAEDFFEQKNIVREMKINGLEKLPRAR